jgi:hypothetical protein
MEMAIAKETKKPYSMRLAESIISDLEGEAETQNRTAANLIDTILKDWFVNNRPNSRTAKAYAKAKGGKK